MIRETTDRIVDIVLVDVGSRYGLRVAGQPLGLLDRETQQAFIKDVRDAVEREFPEGISAEKIESVRSDLDELATDFHRGQDHERSMDHLLNIVIAVVGTAAVTLIVNACLR